MQNRVHRRVIVRDYGKALYKASSRTALLAALVGCIEGHEPFKIKLTARSSTLSAPSADTLPLSRPLVLYSMRSLSKGISHRRNASALGTGSRRIKITI
jgi:hypothetical protein